MDKDKYRDEGLENRFGYYREKNNEELLQEQEQIINEIEYLMFVLNNKDTSSIQKSEIENSDLIFEKEKLNFVKKVLKERNVKKGIKR